MERVTEQQVLSNIELWMELKELNNPCLSVKMGRDWDFIEKLLDGGHELTVSVLVDIEKALNLGNGVLFKTSEELTRILADIGLVSSKVPAT